MVSEPNCHSTKLSTENLLEIELRKTQILMNKSVYLSILELSKIVMYEFWYDYENPKYEEKAKLFYMDTGSFLVFIKADDIYKDIEEGIE